MKLKTFIKKHKKSFIPTIVGGGVLVLSLGIPSRTLRPTSVEAVLECTRNLEGTITYDDFNSAVEETLQTNSSSTEIIVCLENGTLINMPSDREWSYPSYELQPGQLLRVVGKGAGAEFRSSIISSVEFNFGWDGRFSFENLRFQGVTPIFRGAKMSLSKIISMRQLEVSYTTLENMTDVSVTGAVAFRSVVHTGVIRNLRTFNGTVTAYTSTLNVIDQSEIQGYVFYSFRLVGSTINHLKNTVLSIQNSSHALWLFAGSVVGGMNNVTIRVQNGYTRAPIWVDNATSGMDSYFVSANINNVSFCYTESAWQAPIVANRNGEPPSIHRANTDGGRFGETFPLDEEARLIHNISWNQPCL